MDRREFLKATFAASAATVALTEAGSVPVVVDRRVDIEAAGPLPQMVAQQRERLHTPTGTTDLGVIAQHLLRQLALRLDIDGWATTLSERDGEPVWNSGGPRDRTFSEDGHKIGHTVLAYAPGLEGFEGPRRVTLAHQIGTMWEVPSRLTGQRREFYRPMRDDLHNVADIAAEPVRLDQLDPILDDLVRQILFAKVNVFSPGLYMPRMDVEPEGAVGFASRTYGLALRVVRAVGVDRSLMMRADLLGGTFPTESVHS